jgi:hypothetical protein
MDGGRHPRAVCAQGLSSPRRRIKLIAAGLLALCSTACVTDGLTTGSIAAPRSSVAFESIDGPPEDVFRKLVQDLSEEAEARQLAVVSRDTAARYRIRSYVAAHVRRDRTTIAWVWDVYDANQKRTLRISGEEDVGPAGKDAWAAADDQALRRVSTAGMERLASFLTAGPQEAGAPGTGKPLFTFAGGTFPSTFPNTFPSAADDFSPEAAGIFRLPADTSDTANERAETPVDAAPRRPPKSTGATPTNALASISR